MFLGERWLGVFHVRGGLVFAMCEVAWCLLGERWFDVFYVQGGLVVISNVQFSECIWVAEGINFLL